MADLLRRFLLLASVSLMTLLAFGCMSYDPPTEWQEEPPDTLFEIRIGAVIDSLSGGTIIVPITVERADAPIEAFSFAIVIDHPGVNAIIRRGDIFSCGWEHYTAHKSTLSGQQYSTYNIGGYEYLENPTGQTCSDTMSVPYSLGEIEIQLDPDSVAAGEWIPIQFYWEDCTRNLINMSLHREPMNSWSSSSVYVLDQPEPDVFVTITDPHIGFPTFAGCQNTCYDVPYIDLPPSRVGFVNGGIQIVEPAEPQKPGFQVQIEKTHNTLQGQHEDVDVTFSGADDLYGFDILIAYDASALTLANVLPGDVFIQCGWEYFTFRYGANGNCGNACPSGVVRVVGIAETNNGPNHPNVSCVMSGTLFTMDYLVSDDRTFECMYVPVRFFWLDCGDNSIAYTDLVSEPCYYDRILQGISRGVFEFDAMGDEVLDPAEDIANDGVGYPTYLGAQDYCLGGGYYLWCDAIQDSIPKPGPIRWVDFINGGIDIVCAESIDVRGDLNLNGVSHEIADAVLFANYFLNGLGVFSLNQQAQIAISDFNLDGITLGVADLVYLTRIITGDAIPYASLETDSATVVYQANGQLVVDKPMGAAFVTVPGHVTPTLLADNMDMQFAHIFGGNLTRILVHSYDANETFDGAFLSLPSAPDSVELATYDGERVNLVSRVAWQDPTVAPNPFQESTTITLTMPTPGQYAITIFDLLGHKIKSYAGSLNAGMTQLAWTPVPQTPPGTYLVHIVIGQFETTIPVVYQGQ